MSGAASDTQPSRRARRRLLRVNFTTVAWSAFGVLLSCLEASTGNLCQELPWLSGDRPSTGCIGVMSRLRIEVSPLGCGL